MTSVSFIDDSTGTPSSNTPPYYFVEIRTALHAHRLIQPAASLPITIRILGLQGETTVLRQSPSTFIVANPQNPSFGGSVHHARCLPPPEVNPSPIGRSISRHLADFLSCCTIEICLFLSNDEYVMGKAKWSRSGFVTFIRVGRQEIQRQSEKAWCQLPGSKDGF